MSYNEAIVQFISDRDVVGLRRMIDRANHEIALGYNRGFLTSLRNTSWLRCRVRG